MGIPNRDHLFLSDFDAFGNGIPSSFTTPNGFVWRRERQWQFMWTYGLIPFDWDELDVKIRHVCTNETNVIVGLQDFDVEMATVPSGSSVDLVATLVDSFSYDLSTPPDYRWESLIRTVTLPNTPAPGDYWMMNLIRDGADNSIRYVGSFVEFGTV